MENLKQAAIKYAEMGYKIFPVMPNAKNPATDNGFKDASKDVKQIEKWWNENPNYNIGLPTGEINHIVVVDCDIHPEDGADGYRDLVEFANENGEIPDTVLSITQSGGYHFFFKTDKAYRSRIKVYGSIDIRANGGYVVAPPSVGEYGEYTWECGYEIDEFEMADANDTIDKLINLKKEGSGNAGLPEELGEGARNTLLFQEGCRLRSRGYSEVEIESALQTINSARCTPPLPQSDVTTIAKSCARYEIGQKLNSAIVQVESENNLQDGALNFDMNEQGKMAQTIKNATLLIAYDAELRGKIGFNELSGSVYCTDYMPWNKRGNSCREWNNSDTNYLTAWIEQKGIKNKENVYIALQNVAHDNRFNPLTDMLDGFFREYGDSVGYVDKLLPKYMGVEDTPYQRSVMRTFMLGAIARAYNPGTKFDYMLVFTGKQGAGKSTFFKRLAMDDRWFNENLSISDSTRSYEQLRGKWIIEMAELAAMKRSRDMESVKAFITTNVDNYRTPYERMPEDHPRMCVLVGTTNTQDFLTDSTGNRRFLVIEVNKDKVDDATRNKLINKECYGDFVRAWGEMLTIYKSGNYSLTIDDEAREYAEYMQEVYTDQDPMESIILDWLERTKPDKVCVAMIRMEVLKEDIASATWDRRKSSAINAIMNNSATKYKKAWVTFKERYGHCRGWKLADEFSDAEPDTVPFD